MAFDTLIANGTVIDGTGSFRYDADVGVTAGKIAAIGSLESTEASRIIDSSSPPD